MCDRPLGTILFRFYFLISSFIFHSGGLFISKQLKPIKKSIFSELFLMFLNICVFWESLSESGVLFRELFLMFLNI